MSHIEKEAITNARRPKSPRPVAQEDIDKRKVKECNHKYHTLHSDIENSYADSELYITKVDAVFYCEKCLNIEVKKEQIEGDG